MYLMCRIFIESHFHFMAVCNLWLWSGSVIAIRFYFLNEKQSLKTWWPSKRGIEHLHPLKCITKLNSIMHLSSNTNQPLYIVFVKLKKKKISNKTYHSQANKSTSTPKLFTNIIFSKKKLKIWVGSPFLSIYFQDLKFFGFSIFLSNTSALLLLVYNYFFSLCCQSDLQSVIH